MKCKGSLHCFTLSVLHFTVLAGADEADFTYLKKQTGATSGNLSVQIDKLTTCRITPAGQEAFGKYVEALKEYLSAGK